MHIDPDNYLTASLSDEARMALRLYEGDHWQEGRAWTGNLPPPGSKTYDARLSDLKRSLVSSNAIREVVGRHANALLYREPAWQPPEALRPADPEAPKDPLYEALLRWWDREQGRDKLARAAAHLLLTGRGHLRLYVPARYRQRIESREGETFVIPPDPPETQLERIRLEAPSPEQAIYFKNEDEGEEWGYYVWTRQAQMQQEQWAEKVTLMDDGRMLLETGPRLGSTETATLNLGGRLTHYQMERDPLITPQVRQKQSAIDNALTQVHINNRYAGFPAFVATNANLEASALEIGAGKLISLVGFPLTNDSGDVVGYSAATIQRFEPVDPAPILASADAYRREILAEVSQLHTLITGDATASGESRVQALTDFVMSLAPTKAQLERAGLWLIETVLAYAFALARQPLPEGRASFECRVFMGDTPATKQEQAIALYNAGLVSRESAMQMAGVEDPDQEAQLIEAERERDVTPPAVRSADLAGQGA